MTDREMAQLLRGVLKMFRGQDAPVIAHPPNCGFYRRALRENCTCTAEQVAFAVRDALQATEELDSSAGALRTEGQ